MRIVLICVGLLAGAVLSLGLAQIGLPSASADTLVLQATFEFSGSGTDPCGPSPWATATFTDTGPGAVRLTMMSNWAAGTCGDQRIVGWYFNFTGSPLANLMFSHVSGVVADGIGKASNGFQADGDGKFDILFNWPEGGSAANQFRGGQTVVYDITCPGCEGFNAMAFDDLSAPGGGRGRYRHAVRIIGLPSGGSAWLGDTNGVVTPVPEPSTALLLAVGLLGTIVVGRRGVSRS